MVDAMGRWGKKMGEQRLNSQRCQSVVRHGAATSRKIVNRTPIYSRPLSKNFKVVEDMLYISDTA